MATDRRANDLAAALAEQLNLDSLSLSTASLTSSHHHAHAVHDMAALFGPSHAEPETAEHRIVRERVKYLNPSPPQLEQLKSMVQDRLALGRGECILEVGALEEDGTPLGFTPEDLQACLLTLQRAADPLGAHVTFLGEKSVAHVTPQTLEAVLDPATGKPASIPMARHLSDLQGFVLVRKKPAAVDQVLEVRIAVCGNVDAGKSSLLGVLCNNSLDDGRGKARVSLFRHKHEIDSGRTSSLGMECMGFDEAGVQVGVAVNPATEVFHDILKQQQQPPKNLPEIPTRAIERKASWDQIASNCSKLISFVDLAGHERYLKTTVYGLCAAAPDYAMLIIGANMGIIGMTKEHLGLTLALNVPAMVVITKIDMCPPNVLEATIKQLLKILKSAGCRKIPMFVRSSEDVVRVAASFLSERICPIFLVSNVTGEGLPSLRQFLNLLLPSSVRYDLSKPAEYTITETFSVPGVGTVVSGTLMSGTIHQGDTLLLGPDSLGQFAPTQVKSIQMKRVSTPIVTAGHSASLALKKIKRSAIRKGMVLVVRELAPVACREFEAEVLVLFHSSTIGPRYQSMVHIGGVRQTASIVDVDSPTSTLRTGDRALVLFRFLVQPEFIKPDAKILFREGRTKGIGRVTKVYPVGQPAPNFPKSKPSTEAANSNKGGRGAVQASKAPLNTSSSVSIHPVPTSSLSISSLNLSASSAPISGGTPSAAPSGAKTPVVAATSGKESSSSQRTRTSKASASSANA